MPHHLLLDSGAQVEERGRGRGRGGQVGAGGPGGEAVGEGLGERGRLAPPRHALPALLLVQADSERGKERERGRRCCCPGQQRDSRGYINLKNLTIEK